MRQRRTDTALNEGGENSHRPCGAPLGGTKVVCRLRYFARSARAPLRRNSFASKTFSSCRTQIAADKGNSLVRHARTAHCAAAHYAWLTLKEGGKNSHRRGFAAPPPSVREAASSTRRCHRKAMTEGVLAVRLRREDKIPASVVLRNFPVPCGHAPHPLTPSRMGNV